jgi:hypothetical protein
MWHPQLPVSRARHDKEIDRYHGLLMAAYDIIASEYDRALKDGMTKVHAFMAEANHNVVTHPRPDVAARAVFQQAEREFRPDPLTFEERLYGPDDIKEALSAQ